MGERDARGGGREVWASRSPVGPRSATPALPDQERGHRDEDPHCDAPARRHAQASPSAPATPTRRGCAGAGGLHQLTGRHGAIKARRRGPGEALRPLRDLLPYGPSHDAYASLRPALHAAFAVRGTGSTRSRTQKAVSIYLGPHAPFANEHASPHRHCAIDWPDGFCARRCARRIAVYTSVPPPRFIRCGP